MPGMKSVTATFLEINCLQTSHRHTVYAQNKNCSVYTIMIAYGPFYFSLKEKKEPLNHQYLHK